jgi:hypothetical protein
VLTTKHLLDLGALHFLFEPFERALKVAADVLALIRPFEQHAEIVEPSDERIAKLEIVGDAPTTLQRLLRFGLIFPEIRCGDARFELGQFAR